jgi:hypothetical protein
MSDVAEDAIFENQNILPVQFFSGRLNRAGMEPFRRLAFAVLMDAVNCNRAGLGAAGPRPANGPGKMQKCARRTDSQKDRQEGEPKDG